jgi:hypothetical protein
MRRKASSSRRVRRMSLVWMTAITAKCMGWVVKAYGPDTARR